MPWACRALIPLLLLLLLLLQLPRRAAFASGAVSMQCASKVGCTASAVQADL